MLMQRLINFRFVTFTGSHCISSDLLSYALLNVRESETKNTCIKTTKTKIKEAIGFKSKLIMATQEHKKLSTFIKETHNRLRKECQLYGPKEAWSRHISRAAELQTYAEYMKDLATTHWTQMSDPLQKNTSTHCRIQWIKRQCYEYYLQGGKDKYDERERSISAKINSADSSNTSEDTRNVDANSTKKITAIDVGSCYNPLGDDEVFDVTPIDLVPSSSDVFQCDFLNVKIGGTTIVEDKQKISQLGENLFDVCIFSLLLEYLPCPEQRFNCCAKAYDVLKSRGLLIIITPDSKHVGANANIMKSWRFVMAHLGFMRITYEKLKHLHCMTFRKCVNSSVALRWAQMQTFSKQNVLFHSLGKVYIPQDFLKDKPIQLDETEISYSEDEILQSFQELPYVID